MRHRGSLVVAALAALVVAGVVVVGAIVTSGDEDGARATLQRLDGPDAPAPGALPGAIAFSSEGCERGVVDLREALVQLAAESAECNTALDDAGSRGSVDGGVTLAGLAFPITVGERELGVRDLAEALPAGQRFIDVIGYDVAPTALAGVVLATRGPTRLFHLLQIWGDTGLERSVELASVLPDSIGVAGDFGVSGRFVRLSPDGRELAITSEFGITRITMVDLATGEREILPVRSGLAWSPDGRWLALSDGEQILVYGASRTQHVYALEVAAEAIEWRGGA